MKPISLVVAGIVTTCIIGEHLLPALGTMRHFFLSPAFLTLGVFYNYLPDWDWLLIALTCEAYFQMDILLVFYPYYTLLTKNIGFPRIDYWGAIELVIALHSASLLLGLLFNQFYLSKRMEGIQLYN